MKKPHIIVTLIVINLLPLIICLLFYSEGSNYTLYDNVGFLTIVFTPVLIVANCLLTKKETSLWLCNFLLLTSTITGIILSEDYGPYSDGIFAAVILVAIAVIYIPISSVIIVFIRDVVRDILKTIKRKKGISE